MLIGLRILVVLDIDDRFFRHRDNVKPQKNIGIFEFPRILLIRLISKTSCSET